MSSETVSAATNDPPSAPIDPVVKSSTVSQVKNKEVKGAAVAIAIAAAAAATRADEDDMSTFSSDHPYLSVLYKRMRSHRKKLEKIKALEQAQESEGKVLNAQQITLMSNKGTLTKLVAELEMLREQFVAVFKQEMQHLEHQKEVVDEPMILTTESVGQVDAKQECHEVKEFQDDETQEVLGVQDLLDKETVAPVVVDQDTVDREDFGHVYELLKTLHVVNLHQAIGKDVPMVLDFFSKVVLGNTRPPAELSYEENLLESLEEAKKYLMESDKVFACETTYRGLRAFVDELVTISSQASSGKAVAEPVVKAEDFAASVVDETPDVPIVPAEINTMPQISFFTESQLELELANEAVAAAAGQVETAKVVAAELGYERTTEVYDQNGVQTDVAVQTASFSEPIPVPPFSFAAVAAAAAAGVTDTRVLSPAASVGSSDNDKKEVVPGKSSLQGKNPRRRGQERWKEKDSNNNRGGTKSGNGLPTNGSKPRHSRGPRTNDETGGAQGGKRSISKEDGRPRVFHGLRKQNGSPQEQHTGSLIAPHA